MLQQVGDHLQVTIFSCHKKHILIALIGCFHVGSAPFKEVGHLYVAMEASKVKGSHPLTVLDIDPGFKLIFEGRVILSVLQVLPSEGFKVHDVYLELRELVLVGREVQE